MRPRRPYVTTLTDVTINRSGESAVITPTGRPAFHRTGQAEPERLRRELNGRPRDECLNEHWFMSLGQALETIETWRLDYNAVRPHSALGDVPPQEFEQLTLNRATAPILSS
jgi:transposase InsO family protein